MLHFIHIYALDFVQRSLELYFRSSPLVDLLASIICRSPNSLLIKEGRMSEGQN